MILYPPLFTLKGGELYHSRETGKVPPLRLQVHQTHRDQDPQLKLLDLPRVRLHAGPGSILTAVRFPFHLQEHHSHSSSAGIDGHCRHINRGIGGVRVGKGRLHDCLTVHSPVISQHITTKSVITLTQLVYNTLLLTITSGCRKNHPCVC